MKPAKKSVLICVLMYGLQSKFAEVLQQVKKQHKNVKFWNWCPSTIGHIIEEGLNLKTRQRSLCRIGGQNSCSASCFASVFLKEMVEFNRPPCCASCFASVFLKQTVSTVCFKNTKTDTKTKTDAKQLARQAQITYTL